MGMPRDLILVRHGESEANIVQRTFKNDPSAHAPEGFFDRHDSRMRLTDNGRQQAAKTGEFIRREFPNGFDKYYVSALTRTLETAGCLAINGTWDIDDRWRERDWGEYNYLNDEEREKTIPISKLIREQTKWYWCPPGGESLASGVRLRFEDILDTLHREMDGKQVLAVSHGETIGVAKFILERLTPEQWMEQEENPDLQIHNTMLIHYTRTDPETGELSDKLNWRRAICPWDSSKSWNNGQWQKIVRNKYSDTELLELAGKHQLLL